MGMLKYADVIAQAEKKLPHLKPYKLAVLRDMTVEAAEPYFKYFGQSLGLDVQMSFGMFDGIVQEASGQGLKVLGDDLDAVLVWPSLWRMAPALADSFCVLGAEGVAAEKEILLRTLDTIIDGIRARTDKPVLWFDFAPLPGRAYGIADDDTELSQAQMVQEINEALQQKLSKAGGYRIQMGVCANRVGLKNFYDLRRWHMAQAPYTLEAMEELAAETAKYVRALAGKAKKCLVFDADDTLWGGVIGEDGLDGIALSTEFPGSLHRAIQQKAVDLYHRGVIIAVCSKNNEADVWEVFDRHEGMVLKKEHLAAYRINWDNKADNIKAIAHELNIGLDSLVFVDNSGYEINLVRETLPEVLCIELDKERLLDLPYYIDRMGFFDTLRVTGEDRQRSASYAQDKQRAALRAEKTDLEGYLKSLSLKAILTVNADIDIPRAAQMCGRTNQFNLTTIRHDEAAIKKFATGKNSDAFMLRLSDRFGDLGNIGLAIVRYEGDKAVLDTFLMSCRALGRRAETWLLDRCVKAAQARGAKTMEAHFIPTAKNALIKDFLPEHGFKTTPEASGGYKAVCGLADWRCDLLPIAEAKDK